MSNTPEVNVTVVEAAPEKKAARLNAFSVGAFLALVVVCVQALFSITTTFIGTFVPYIAGVGMFVALITIFGAIISTLKALRKSASKASAIWDCYVAVAVIGVLGYFLAACVQTFQAGGNPGDYWTYGATAAVCFAGLFGGGKYVGELLAEGKKSEKK